MSVQSPPSDITPKRKLGIKNSMTPMSSIKEEDSNENEVKKTPAPYNPFDVNADSLYFHSCSPFFATISRNKKNDGTFRWSIEQLSVLCPADIDIDETSFPDDCIDSDQEVKVQKAIDTFFSQNSIVPSPWSDSPSYSEGRRNRFRRTTMSFNQPKAESCDTGTQTALSIPPNVDLTEILGSFFLTNEEESFCSRENSQEEIDPLSTSSLRRKLFASEEECVSPPRVENKNLFSARLWSTPTAKSRSAYSTPASDVLSSSPITPPNCSESCNILSPPPVSPISFANDRNSLSVHMKSMADDSDSIFYSPENMTCSHNNEMSFLTESQEANPSSSCNNSEKQDTGYVTGSISSSQNMNFSDGNCGLISRISPVMELMEECGLSNSISGNMSLKHPSEENSLSFDACKNVPVSSSNPDTNSWFPTCASTPAYFNNL